MDDLGAQHLQHLQRLSALPAGLLDASAAELQQQLGAPTVIELAGEEDAPPLFVAVLLHGNETTGWTVMKDLLRREADALPRPLVLLIGDVAAAAMGKRHQGQESDHNRIWRAESDSALGRQLWQLREELRMRKVCAAIDIHNTSGHNPPHALHMGGLSAAAMESATAEFAAAFSGTVLKVRHSLGTCMEAFAPFCPSVTIECGKPEDTEGKRLAMQFIGAALYGKTAPPPREKQRHYTLAARISAREGARLCFGAAADTAGATETAEIILPQDIDHWNLTVIPAGTALAQVRGVEGMPLQARNAAGEDVITHYLHRHNDEIRTTRDIIPVMLTPSTEQVKQDCLCYFLGARE